MDLGSITAAFGSVKAVGEIAKGLISLHTTAEVQAKAIELNSQIIDAQQQIFSAQATQTELVNRVRELEGQIAGMKDWDAQKKRYKLAAPFPGCMVYALQKSMSGGEPPHYLCTSCYEKGQRSILQGKQGPVPKAGIRHSLYVCPNLGCRAEAVTPWVNVIAPQYSEDLPSQA